MNHTNFGARNELQESAQREREREIAADKAAIGLVCIFVFAVYALAAYLEQLLGVIQ